MKFPIKQQSHSYYLINNKIKTKMQKMKACIRLATNCTKKQCQKANTNTITGMVYLKNNLEHHKWFL